MNRDGPLLNGLFRKAFHLSAQLETVKFAGAGAASVSGTGMAFVRQIAYQNFPELIKLHPNGGNMDGDLENMSREQLIAEVLKLRQGIRDHRDKSGHDLCWHHPALWSLLPEKLDPLPVVPDWPHFLEGCIRYRQSLDEQIPQAPRSDEPFHG